jgi:multidrug transporter EmrE-like cation transporter
MRLLLLCALQSLLSVGGTGLLTMALHGRELSPAALTASLGTWQAVAGILCLFASFLVMGAIISFARLSVYIPLTTGLTFLCTVAFAVLVQREQIGVPTWVGMALILAGVWVISLRKDSPLLP